MANLNLKITEVAKEHGMSVTELADKLGVKASSLSVSIYRNSFSLDKLGEIADILGVEVPELFEAYTTSKQSDSSVDAVCPHCGEPIKVNVVVSK